jgi:TPR repeat protein
MNAREREKRYIRKWRPAALRGDSMAMMNVAAAYRLLDNARLAFRWFKKAADLADGDALAEVGYCLHHGAGTRKDLTGARWAYRAAIASRQITQFAREEAMYNLAVLLLSERSAGSHRAAASLLRRADLDGDYPQARVLLQSVRSGAEVRRICVCRRGLMPCLGTRKCPLHARAGQPGIAAGGRARTGGGASRRGRAPAAECQSR